jgi:hypothetical protein
MCDKQAQWLGGQADYLATAENSTAPVRSSPPLQKAGPSITMPQAPPDGGAFATRSLARLAPSVPEGRASASHPTSQMQPETPDNSDTA